MIFTVIYYYRCCYSSSHYSRESLRSREGHIVVGFCVLFFFFLLKCFLYLAGCCFFPNICYSPSQVPVSWGETEGPHATALTYWGTGKSRREGVSKWCWVRCLCFQWSVGREGREILISIYRHKSPALSILQREGKQILSYPGEWYPPRSPWSVQAPVDSLPLCPSSTKLHVSAAAFRNRLNYFRVYFL